MYKIYTCDESVYVSHLINVLRNEVKYINNTIELYGYEFDIDEDENIKLDLKTFLEFVMTLIDMKKIKIKEEECNEREI